MAKLVYMPTAADFDTVIVAGITFPAYQAVDIDDANSDLIAKLKKNPWFALEDAVDADRQAAWKRVRDAHAQAAAHRAEAERLEHEA